VAPNEEGGWHRLRRLGVSQCRDSLFGKIRGEGGRMHRGEIRGEGGECMEARCMERGVGRGFEKDCDNPLSFLHPLLDNVCVDRHGNAVIVSCFSR
jgi:hypothetical protein